jgi:hypothetical protein
LRAMIAVLIAFAALSAHGAEVPALAASGRVDGICAQELISAVEAARGILDVGVYFQSVDVVRQGIVVGTATFDNGNWIVGKNLRLELIDGAWKRVGEEYPAVVRGHQGVSSQDLKLVLMDLPQELPYLFIRAVSEHEIRVNSGFSAGPLSGGGRWFVYSLETDKWKQTRSGFWVS